MIAGGSLVNGANKAAPVLFLDLVGRSGDGGQSEELGRALCGVGQFERANAVVSGAHKTAVAGGDGTHADGLVDEPLDTAPYPIDGITFGKRR